MSEILLATDLDGTLVGNNDSLKSLNSALSTLRDEKRLKLAYVTGRSLESYNQLRRENSLLVPDALVTAVGTEIYWNGAELSSDWPQAVDWDRESIEAALTDIPELIRQPESEQRPYKVSFYLKDNSQILDQVLQELSSFCVDVIYSHREYLDILPKGVNKGSALNHLASIWKIEYPNIIACGDSANDIGMLAVSKAVIVANSIDELAKWAVDSGINPDIYIANQPYAAGVAEGLKNFQVL